MLTKTGASLVVRLHWNFEWDADKAEANVRKYRISFELAAEVLRDSQGDRYHLDEDDSTHSEVEDRYLTTASSPGDRRIILVIAWTDRSTDDEMVSRIISARKATRWEVEDYVRSPEG